MKYLNTIFDHQLNVNFKLYQINARELSQRLLSTYNLPTLTLQSFNSESKVMEHKEEIRLLLEPVEGVDTDNWRFGEAKKVLDQFEKNDWLSNMERDGILLGYELMPIAVSVKGNIEDPTTRIELIDGFKRMFWMDRIPDIDIMVKVYDEFSDTEWINAMILYNSWKFVDNEGSRKYMDRGFQLGLFYRYGIQLAELQFREWNIYQSFNIYTTGRDLEVYQIRDGSNGGTYQTLWGNHRIAEDIRSIHEIMTLSPTFRLEKKGKVEELVVNEGVRNNGIGRIKDVFVSLLGEIRRKELSLHVSQRSPFNIKIVTDYFSDPTLQKQFIKVGNMSVGGHICNYIRDHLREDIKQRMFEGMGYPYVPPTPKEEIHYSKLDWNNIKF